MSPSCETWLAAACKFILTTSHHHRRCSKSQFSLTYHHIITVALTFFLLKCTFLISPLKMAFHGNANVQLDLGNIIAPLMKTALRLLNSETAEANEAIRRSGSDELTELKLAALLGRLRIDDIVKTNFRAIVASSNHSVISRFMQDLVLESGAGPTIQQALSSSNPALLSMAIQISFLAFGHGHQSLAEAITQAIEEALVLSDSPVHRGLDYVSVLGVITVCQQQTAKFGWSYVYESVEAKILQSMNEERATSQQTKRRRTTSNSGASAPDLPASVAERGIPYVILKSS